MLRSMPLQLGLAFCVLLCILLVQVLNAGPKSPRADEFVYLNIANDLNRSGVFSDGLFAEKQQGTQPRPGRFFAPVYPLFLAAMSRFDPALADFISCQVENRSRQSAGCPAAPLSLLVAQSVLAALQMTCVFAIALVLSGSTIVAGLSLVVALFTGEASYYARTYLTENVTFLGFYLFLATGVAAFFYRRSWWFASAGGALAFTALCRPSYLYLFYAMAAFLVVMALSRLKQPRMNWRHVVAFTAAGMVVLVPWMIRNVVLFGDTELSAGYGGFILVQRVAYNAMTWSEWGTAFIFWLPDFGDSLAAALFPKELYVRLGFNDPTSFYLVGNNALMKETLAASGGRAGHLSYLLKYHLFGDLFKHVLVTIPLTLRGIWAGKFLALAGVTLLIPVGLAMAHRARLAPFAFLILAPFFMAGLHGFVSVNVVRYNIPLIALYAFVVSYALVDVMGRLGWLSSQAIAAEAPDT